MKPLDSGTAPRARAHSVLVGLGFAALTYGVSAIGALAMRGSGSGSGSPNFANNR